MQKLVFALVALLALQSASADWAIFANYGYDRFCSEIQSFIALEVDECMVIDGSYSRMWDGQTYSYYNANECEEDDATLDTEDVDDCFEYHPGRYAKFVVGDLATPVNSVFPLAEALYTGDSCTVDELHGDVSVFPFEFVENQFNNTQDIQEVDDEFNNHCENNEDFTLIYQDYDGVSGFTGPWEWPSTTEWLIFKTYGPEEDCDTDGEDASIDYFAIEAGFCQNGRYTDGETFDYWGGSCENVGSSDFYTDDNSNCFEYNTGVYAKRVANGMEYPISATYVAATLEYDDCTDRNTLAIHVSLTLASEVTDHGYNDCINDDTDSYFIWLHEDYEEYRLANHDYNDLSGSSNWVIFGNHAADDECGEEPHSFIAMEHDICYTDESANAYRTDGDAYARFVDYDTCEADDLADGATYEADIDECFQLNIDGETDYYTAVDKDRSYPINADYPLAWAEYDDEDCDGEDLTNNYIYVVKADDINEIWAQDYDSKIIGPQRVEKVVHSCETWGDGSYYYWGDEVLESMAIDMNLDWTESEDSASMITSSLLMIIAAFAMIFA